MEVLTYGQLLAMHKISEEMRTEDVSKIFWAGERENLKKIIEDNPRLTVRNKIILEMLFGLWNGSVYSDNDAFKLYELSEEELRKIWNRSKRTRRCCSEGDDLKHFLDND